MSIFFLNSHSLSIALEHSPAINAHHTIGLFAMSFLLINTVQSSCCCGMTIIFPQYSATVDLTSGNRDKTQTFSVLLCISISLKYLSSSFSHGC